MALTQRPSSSETKKAVTTALGRNPAVKTKGESMCNDFHLLLSTTTIALYHNLLECCQVLFKIFLPTSKLPEELKRIRSSGNAANV
jgi:hypothetical protein